MDTTTEFVPVIFRTDGSEVTAIFPTLPADVAGQYLTCYAHIGQHGSCAWRWALEQTRPASLEEAAPLRAELEAIGYRLRVVRRRTAAHDQACYLARETWRRLALPASEALR